MFDIGTFLVEQAVSNAFRLGCELGLDVVAIRCDFSQWVSNAFRLGCELGLPSHF